MSKPQEWTNTVQGPRPVDLDAEMTTPTPKEKQLAELAEKNKDSKPERYDITSKNSKALRVVHDWHGNAVSIAPGATSEVAYTSYARASVARTTGGWTVVGTGPASCSPVSNITFPAGTGGSGTVTNFSTGKTGGGATAILWSGTVTPNIVSGSGVTPVLTTATTITLS